MYKKITVLKNQTDDVTDLNDRVRSEISDFLQANGWTLTAKGNSYNIVLKKDYSPQDATCILNPYIGKRGAVNANYDNTLLSISRHSTNGRVITILCGENPKTRGSNSSEDVRRTATGVGYIDDYPSFGQFGYNDSFPTGYPQNCIRIDDLTESLQVEMFYFIDSDLQEEFYFIFRNNRLFGRESPVDSEFYQTVAFAKIPGVEMICTSTLRENPALAGCGDYSDDTIKNMFSLGDSNGVKYIKEWGTSWDLYYCYQLPHFVGANMATTPNTINPRWDAPDSTDNLWLHLAYFRCINPVYDGGNINDLGVGFSKRKYPFGLWSRYNWYWYQTTVNDVDAWRIETGMNLFESYSFLQQQGCSSEYGGTVLVPLKHLYEKGVTVEIRHAWRYNMYHTRPETLILSDAYKCYPTLRRSLMGYATYTKTGLPDRGNFKNPGNPSWRCYTGCACGSGNGYYGNEYWTSAGWWFTEEFVDGRSQPVLKSSWIGEEIDASGYEGFAMDYTDYDPANVSVIDLTS